MNRSLFPLALCALAFAPGCASLQLDAKFKLMGEYDATGESKIQQTYQKLQQGAARSGGEVRVLVDAVPKGIVLRDGTISVAERYAHRVIGKFQLRPDGGAFPGYRDRWRRYLCYPQRPLLWVTLGVWSLVPLNYPCFTTSVKSKEEIIQAVRNLARAAGGDVAAITFVGESDKGDTAFGAVGVVIRLDPRMKQLETERVPDASKRKGLAI